MYKAKGILTIAESSFVGSFFFDRGKAEFSPDIPFDGSVKYPEGEGVFKGGVEGTYLAIEVDCLWFFQSSIFDSSLELIAHRKPGKTLWREHVILTELDEVVE